MIFPWLKNNIRKVHCLKEEKEKLWGAEELCADTDVGLMMMGYQALPCRRATRIRPLNVPALLERFSSKPSKSENVTKVCLAQISLFKWRIIFQFTEERVVLCFK